MRGVITGEDTSMDDKKLEPKYEKCARSVSAARMPILYIGYTPADHSKGVRTAFEEKNIWQLGDAHLDLLLADIAGQSAGEISAIRLTCISSLVPYSVEVLRSGNPTAWETWSVLKNEGNRKELVAALTVVEPTPIHFPALRIWLLELAVGQVGKETILVPEGTYAG
jgi:hypothetical protein